MSEEGESRGERVGKTNWKAHMRQRNWMSEQWLWCLWRRLNVHIKDLTRVVCAVSSHVRSGVTIAFQTLETYHLLNQNLKKEGKKIMKKKNYIKEGGLLGRVWTWHRFVSHTTPQLPSNGAVQRFWRWRGSIAVSLGSKKCHCRGPTQWHVLKGKVTSSELVILPKSPVWGSQAFTSTCSWNEGGAAGNRRDPGAESHVYSHPGSSSQNSTFQHSTEELSRF